MDHTARLTWPGWLSQPRSAKSAETVAAPGTWLDAFRRAVDAQRQVFADHDSIGARSTYDGVGEGGDRTLVIDRLCEDAIFSELERLHAEGLAVHGRSPRSAAPSHSATPAHRPAS